MCEPAQEKEKTMKKGLKKLLSVVLTMAIMLVSVPAVAFGAGEVTDMEGKPVDVVKCVETAAADPSAGGYKFSIPKETKEVSFPIQIDKMGKVEMVLMPADLLDEATEAAALSAQALDTKNIAALVAQVEDDEDAPDEESDDISELLKKSNLTMSLYDANNQLVCESEVYQMLGIMYVALFDYKETGTYTAKIKVNGEVTEDQVYDFLMVPALISAEDGVLVPNQPVMGVSLENKHIYYRVDMKQDGYVTFSGNNMGKMVLNDEMLNDTSAMNASLKLQLCDSKKYPMAKAVTFNAKKTEAVVALRKGTYYFRLKEEKDTSFMLQMSTKAVKSVAGTKKANAKAIKLKQAVEGIQVLNEKKENWYKVNVTSKKNLSVSLSRITENGTFNVYIYNAKGKRVACETNTTKVSGTNKSNVTLRSINKLPKGTYYIKVVKSNANATGYYKLTAK